MAILLLHLAVSWHTAETYSSAQHASALTSFHDNVHFHVV
jgi:hypothetical protein